MFFLNDHCSSKLLVILINMATLLTGFSLGAQFVGALGLAMDKKMTRITGLDPAGNILGQIVIHHKDYIHCISIFLGPEFFLYPPDQRLSEDDAELVDVIHTATPALITVRSWTH